MKVLLLAYSSSLYVGTRSRQISPPLEVAYASDESSASSYFERYPLRQSRHLRRFRCQGGEPERVSQVSQVSQGASRFGGFEFPICRHLGLSRG
jgi:hypothetical protein